MAFALVLALAGTAMAGPCSAQTQPLNVPTLIEAAPPGGRFLNNVNAWYAPVGSSFTLAPVGPDVCLDPPTCEHILPDFNVQWFAGSTTFGSTVGHNHVSGPDGGPIPSAATYGVVYMRYGPDGIGDAHVPGALFRLEICP